jgi:hypothetical protein
MVLMTTFQVSKRGYCKQAENLTEPLVVEARSAVKLPLTNRFLAHYRARGLTVEVLVHDKGRQPTPTPRSDQPES